MKNNLENPPHPPSRHRSPAGPAERTKRPALLRQLLQRLLKPVCEVIFPPSCMGCGTTLESASEMLCPLCWERLNLCICGTYCPTCGATVSEYVIYQQRCPMCIDQPVYYQRLFRVGRYEHLLKQLLLQAKHIGRVQVCEFLARLLAAAMAADEQASQIEALVPVPLHWRRRIHRGFDQAVMLTGALAKILHVPVLKALQRVRPTRFQSSLPSKTARIRNLRGALALKQPASTKLAGRVICLVDDIRTTGATLNEAARIAAKARPRQVLAAVVTAGKVPGLNQWLQPAPAPTA